MPCSLSIIRTAVLCLGMGGTLAQAEEKSAGSKNAGLYHPPNKGEWARVKPAAIGWNEKKLKAALDYAGNHASSGVVILHRGKMLAEQYWELEAAPIARLRQKKNATGHPVEDVASVQKSVVSILVGIAQEKGLLKVEDRVDKYLGKGWSKAPPDKEKAITIRHLITMTSGLTDRGLFEAQPGSKWRYNTPVYAKMMDVLEKAAGKDRHEITRKWLTEPMGMTDSGWVPRGSPELRLGNRFGFATTARDLARFGLMMLAEGKWGDKTILGDRRYLKAATTTSQKRNPYYGYLWWLNRNADSPGRKRLAAAPADMFSANGAMIRRCYVVPSLQLVVTRLGAPPKGGRAFDQQFWKLLMDAAP